MNSIILLTHILIASGLLIATTVVATAAIRQKATQAYKPMLVSFVATVSSGTVLLFTTGSIGRVCATMALVSLLVGVVHHFYKTRVITQTV